MSESWVRIFVLAAFLAVFSGTYLLRSRVHDAAAYQRSRWPAWFARMDRALFSFGFVLLQVVAGFLAALGLFLLIQLLRKL